MEKLDMHKGEWEKEMRYWVDQKETAERDEQGSATYSAKKREEELRRKNEK
jgi:hypothetical protein